jgi:hypothetical protein
VLGLLLLFLLLLLMAVLALLIRLDLAVFHTRSSFCQDYTPANRNALSHYPLRFHKNFQESAAQPPSQSRKMLFRNAPVVPLKTSGE